MTHDYHKSLPGYSPDQLLRPPVPVPDPPLVTMGHLDAIGGALAGAVQALERGARTREWDSLQAAMGEAWADIQRAAGYAVTLKARVPDGPGFEGEHDV
jgi:hypothetical protein